MSASPFGNLAAAIVGKRKSKGDPDCPTDPVRKNSYHEDRPQAQPWLSYRRCTRPEWNAQKGAIRGAFDRLAKLHRLEMTKARREKRPAPENRLHDGDRDILAYLLDRFNHVTGMLYPALETISIETGWSHGFVKASIARLKNFGFINWVRRTKTKEGAEGQAGPQLEQTSSAYFFEWGSSLVAEARATYLNLLAIALRRSRALMAAVSSPLPPIIADKALQGTVQAFGAAIDARDRASSAST